MNRPLTVLALTAAVLVGCGGEAPAKPPDGIEVAGLTIDSTAVDKRMKVKVVVPEGDAEGRPLLVFLHGRGGNESSSLRKPMFDALKALGTRAPIVAFPAGDDHSYWHNRKSGAYGRYVMKEVIPEVVRRFGADRRRVAVGGISMGGFGAFDLARAHPKRFCAVGGHSPAVWRSGGETAPGAFDDAADFARHDVIAGAGAFAGQTVWLDAGDGDPFRPGDQAFTAAVRDAGAHLTAKTWPGAHDNAYWDRHWRQYLRFYARALSRC